MDELFTSSDEETTQKQVTQEWGTKKANFYEEQEQLSEATDPEDEEEEYKEALQIQATLAIAASPVICPYLISTQATTNYEDNVIDFSKVELPGTQIECKEELEPLKNEYTKYYAYISLNQLPAYAIQYVKSFCQVLIYCINNWDNIDNKLPVIEEIKNLKKIVDKLQPGEQPAQMEDNVESEDSYYEQIEERNAAKMHDVEDLKKMKELDEKQSKDKVFKGVQRNISKLILKNQGLVRKRKKEDRNSRVKHRLKYDKMMKKRKYLIQECPKQKDYYDGEKSGINAEIIKSTQITR